MSLEAIQGSLKSKKIFWSSYIHWWLDVKVCGQSRLSTSALADWKRKAERNSCNYKEEALKHINEGRSYFFSVSSSDGINFWQDHTKTKLSSGGVNPGSGKLLELVPISWSLLAEMSIYFGITPTGHGLGSTVYPHAVKHLAKLVSEDFERVLKGMEDIGKYFHHHTFDSDFTDECSARLESDFEDLASTAWDEINNDVMVDIVYDEFHDYLVQDATNCYVAALEVYGKLHNVFEMDESERNSKREGTVSVELDSCDYYDIFNLFTVERLREIYVYICDSGGLDDLEGYADEVLVDKSYSTINVYNGSVCPHKDTLVETLATAFKKCECKLASGLLGTLKEEAKALIPTECPNSDLADSIHDIFHLANPTDRGKFMKSVSNEFSTIIAECDDWLVSNDYYDIDWHEVEVTDFCQMLLVVLSDFGEHVVESFLHKALNTLCTPKAEHSVESNPEREKRKGQYRVGDTLKFLSDGKEVTLTEWDDKLWNWKCDTQHRYTADYLVDKTALASTALSRLEEGQKAVDESALKGMYYSRTCGTCGHVQGVKQYEAFVCNQCQSTVSVEAMENRAIQKEVLKDFPELQSKPVMKYNIGTSFWSNGDNAVEWIVQAYSVETEKYTLSSPDPDVSNVIERSENYLTEKMSQYPQMKSLIQEVDQLHSNYGCDAQCGTAPESCGNCRQSEIKSEKIMTRIVTVSIVDNSPGLKNDEDRLVATYKDIATTKSDEQVKMEILMNKGVAQKLKTHNEKRESLVDEDVLNRTGNEVMLRPVELHDLDWIVKE